MAGTRPQTRLVTIVFWVLLFYILAALLWWLLSLEHQNREIYELKRAQIGLTTNTYSTGTDATVRALSAQYGRNTRKFIYEGVTFLLLILFGAAYIYRLVRRQFRVQQQQQNFVMAITHELKTPLSVARLNLETVLKRQLPEDKQHRLLQASLEETMRLDTLINNVLLSSQLDDEAYRPTRELVDLSAIVIEVLQEAGRRNPERQHACAVPAGISVTGDPLLLRLLVSNLLENANKYAKDAGFTCTLSEERDAVLLRVADNGPGIPEEEKKLVFEKFYRVGNEQTRRTKGTGLGLYICSRIARAHGATISLTDTNPQGATFTVRFKKP
ncbi:MAG: two-component sensor histidine kinase [Sphingobacteriales bacterium]|nr:MAG: two-component sensor histidine kinase [Sphingobacteriales bacterium]